MPTLNIAGRRVTVGDEFLSMTPDQQNASVEEIAKSIGLGGGSAPDTSGFSDDLKKLTPQVSQGRAALEGVLSGASANLRDEIYGASRASGLPEWLGGFRAPVGAARLAYEAVTEPGTATQEYERGRDAMRVTQKAVEEQHPATYLAGQVGGGVALPVGGALGGATLAARAGRAAAVGAGYGAAAGFGEGEGAGDRLSRATAGGILGGVVGGASAPLVEGLVHGASALARPVASAIRGAVNPAAEAERRVASAIGRDIAADPGATTRLTPAEAAISPDARLIDLGGDLTRRLADVAGTASPEGRVALNQAINARYEGQSQRFVNWLNDRFGFPNAEAQQAALEDTARGVNRAAYGRAYREGAGGIWSPELERLAGSDAIASAMRAAAKNSGDEAIVSGHGAINPRITFTPDGRIQFARGPSGIPTYPDLQFWDLTRRELSDAARRAGPGTSEARRLNAFARSLNDELDRVVPSYREARAGAASFFGAENALEAGQNFVSQNFAAGETRRALARMNDNERRLFQDGFVSRFIETIDRTGDRRNVLNQIGQTPAAREKLEIALGRDGWNELQAMLRVEGIMDLPRHAVQSNSWTARRLYDLGLVGGAGIGGSGVYNQDPQQMTTAAILAALSSGGKKIDQRVMRRVAEMLVSDNAATYQRGIRAIARNDTFMRALENFDRRVAAAGSEQVPTGLAPQAMGIGRADDQQPNIERPIR